MTSSSMRDESSYSGSPAMAMLVSRDQSHFFL